MTSIAETSIHRSWMRFAPSANARSLAVLRIATAVAALPTAWAWARSDWRLIPRELWYPPRGTGWAVDLVPISSGLLKAAGVVFLISVLGVLVGYRARWAAGLAVVAGLYAGWIPHFAGKVNHNHHIIWFLALLALAPCDDALALRRGRNDRPPEAYAMPALAGVLVLGIIYLSSGIPKLMTGMDWAFSDNVRNLMWNMWWEKQHSVPLPVDEWPVVYQAFGAATIAFEVLFLPAALHPRTRRWIRWIGLGFHLAVRLVLAINFWTLAILYVVLFDWDPNTPKATPRNTERVSMAPFILVIAIATGAFTIPAGWPLSAYPGFAGIARPVYTDYELVSNDGAVLVTRSPLADRHGPERARPMAAAAIGTGREEALLQYVTELSGEAPGHYYGIRRIEIPTAPGDS